MREEELVATIRRGHLPRIAAIDAALDEAAPEGESVSQAVVSADGQTIWLKLDAEQECQIPFNTRARNSA